MDSSAPDELFLWDISHPYGPTGHRCVHVVRRGGLWVGCRCCLVVSAGGRHV